MAEAVGNLFYKLGDTAGYFSDACERAAYDVARIDLQNSYLERIKRMNMMPPIFGYYGGLYSPFSPCISSPMFSVFSGTPSVPSVLGATSTPVVTGSSVPSTTAVACPQTSSVPTTTAIVCPQASSPFGTFDAVFSLTSPATFGGIINNTPIDTPILEVLGGPNIDWNNVFAGVNRGQAPTAASPLASTVPQATQAPQAAPVQTAPTMDAASCIDRLYYPDRYAQPAPVTNSQPQQQNSAQAPGARVTATVAQSLGMKERPLWYTSISDKNPNELNEEEKRLKETYENIMIRNGVYSLDRNGDIQYDDAGLPKVNANIHNKIKDLYAALEGKDEARVLKLIKDYSADELAAIDYHWRSYCEYARKESNPKTLRQMIQIATQSRFTPEMNGEWGKCSQIYKILNDKTLMKNPSSMADAFYQVIHAAKFLDAGIDNDAAIKLLKMLENHPVYANAVKEEYSKRFADALDSELRTGKLGTNSAEVKRLALQVF